MFPLLFHDEEDMRYRGIFRRYDKDNSGHLDRDELREAFHDAKAYPSEADIDHLFHKYDTDGDRHIGYDEFVKMINDLESRMKEDSEMEARSIFASTAMHLLTDADRK